MPTIVGGSHVTFMADEALAHADYVARGEGGDAQAEQQRRTRLGNLGEPPDGVSREDRRIMGARRAAEGVGAGARQDQESVELTRTQRDRSPELEARVAGADLEVCA